MTLIGRYTNLLLMEYTGVIGCPKCDGSGFKPIPWWLWLKARLIERLPKQFIRKRIVCDCAFLIEMKR